MRYESSSERVRRSETNFIRTPGDQTASENSEWVPKGVSKYEEVRSLFTLVRRLCWAR